MKNSPFFYPLLICAALALIMGAVVLALYTGEDPLPPQTQDTTDKTDPAALPEMNFLTDLSDFEPAMSTEDSRFLILINKENRVSLASKPEQLVKVKDAKKVIELDATAQAALEAMFIEMRAAGFSDVFVTSAYRSYDYQSYLFNFYIEEEMAKGLSFEAARDKVLTYSAEPGTSEHQSGLAVDLMTSGMSELDETFADHPVYDWLTENAWKFGFVLRFPEDKTEITGYSYEPWHYRFVGRRHAYEIHKNRLCLEEYILMKK